MLFCGARHLDNGIFCLLSARLLLMFDVCRVIIGQGACVGLVLHIFWGTCGHPVRAVQQTHYCRGMAGGRLKGTGVRRWRGVPALAQAVLAVVLDVLTLSQCPASAAAACPLGEV